MAVCNPHQIVERQTQSINFLHKVPHGLVLDDVLAHAYWANAWKRFEGKECSTVDFLAEDGTWEAYARVTRVVEGRVTFRILHHWQEDPVSIEIPEGYRVEFLSDNGWRALDPNGTIIIANQPQRGDVMNAALEHATAFAPKRKKVAA
jgi:hypothetical protein